MKGFYGPFFNPAHRTLLLHSLLKLFLSFAGYLFHIYAASLGRQFTQYCSVHSTFF